MAESKTFASFHWLLDGETPAVAAARLQSLDLTLQGPAEPGLSRRFVEQAEADATGKPAPATAEWHLSMADGADRALQAVVDLRGKSEAGAAPASSLTVPIADRFLGISVTAATSGDALLRGGIALDLRDQVKAITKASSRRLWCALWPTNDPNDLHYLIVTPSGLYAAGLLPQTFYPVTAGEGERRLVALRVPQNHADDGAARQGAWVLDSFPFRVAGVNLLSADEFLDGWARDFDEFQRASRSPVRFLDDVELAVDGLRDVHVEIRQEIGTAARPSLSWRASGFHIDLVIATPSSREAHFHPNHLEGRLVATAKGWQAESDSDPTPHRVRARWVGLPRIKEGDPARVNRVEVRLLGTAGTGAAAMKVGEDVRLAFNENLVAVALPTVPALDNDQKDAWLCTSNGWVQFRGCGAGAESAPGLGQPTALSGAIEIGTIMRDLSPPLDTDVPEAGGLDARLFALPGSLVELRLEEGHADDRLGLCLRVDRPVSIVQTPTFWLQPSPDAGRPDAQPVPDVLAHPTGIGAPPGPPDETELRDRFGSATFFTALAKEGPAGDSRLRAVLSHQQEGNRFRFQFQIAGPVETVVWSPPRAPSLAGWPLAQGMPLSRPGYTDRYFDANRGLVPHLSGVPLHVDFPDGASPERALPQVDAAAALTIHAALLRETPYFLTTLPGIEVDLSAGTTEARYRFACPELDESFAATAEKRPEDKAPPIPGSTDVRLTWVDGRTGFTVPAAGANTKLLDLLPRTAAKPDGAVDITVDVVRLQGPTPQLSFKFNDSGVEQKFVRDKGLELPSTGFVQQSEDPRTYRHVGEVTVGLQVGAMPPNAPTALPTFEVKTAPFAANSPAVVRNGQPLLTTAKFVLDGANRVVTQDAAGRVAAEPIDAVDGNGPLLRCRGTELTAGAVRDYETRTESFRIRNVAGDSVGPTRLHLDLVAIPVSPDGTEILTIDPEQERWRLHNGEPNNQEDGGWPRLLGFYLYPVKLVAYRVTGTTRVALVDVIFLRARPKDAAPPDTATGLVRLKFTVPADGVSEIRVVDRNEKIPSRLEYTFDLPEPSALGVVRLAAELPENTIIQPTEELSATLKSLTLGYPAGDLVFVLPAGHTLTLTAGTLSFKVPEKLDGTGYVKIEEAKILPANSTWSFKAFDLGWAAGGGTQAPWALVWRSTAANASAWELRLGVGGLPEGMTIPLTPPESLGNRRLAFEPNPELPVHESMAVAERAWWRRADDVSDGGFLVATFQPKEMSIGVSGELIAHLVDRNPSDAIVVFDPAKGSTVNELDRDETGPLAGLAEIDRPDGPKGMLLIRRNATLQWWTPGSDEMEVITGIPDGVLPEVCESALQVGDEQIIIFEAKQFRRLDLELDADKVTVKLFGQAIPRPAFDDPIDFINRFDYIPLESGIESMAVWAAPLTGKQWEICTWRPEEDPTTVTRAPSPLEEVSTVALTRDRFPVIGGVDPAGGTRKNVLRVEKTGAPITLETGDARATDVITDPFSPARRFVVVYGDDKGRVWLWRFDPAGQKPVLLDEPPPGTGSTAPAGIRQLVPLKNDRFAVLRDDGTITMFHYESAADKPTKVLWEHRNARQSLRPRRLMPLADFRPAALAEPPRSRLLAQISLQNGVQTVALTGRFVAANRHEVRQDTAKGARIVHRVSAYFDRVPLPAEVVFAGRSAAPQSIAVIAEHFLRFSGDGLEYTWQVPQVLRLTAPHKLGFGTESADRPLAFDAGATFLLRPASEEASDPPLIGPASIARANFLGLRLRSCTIGRFERTTASAAAKSKDKDKPDTAPAPDILEVRLPALLARGPLPSAPTLTVPTAAPTPSTAGTYRFLTAGVQPSVAQAQLPEVTAVALVRRGPLAPFLRHDGLLRTFAPDAVRPAFMDSETKPLSFRPTTLPELAGLVAFRDHGNRPLDAATLLGARGGVQANGSLARTTVAEAAVTVSLVLPEQLRSQSPASTDPGVDAQLATFVAGRLTWVATERVRAPETAPNWGRRRLSGLCSADGGIVVANFGIAVAGEKKDYRPVTAVAAPPELGTREFERGRSAIPPEHALAARGEIDARCGYPDFAPPEPHEAALARVVVDPTAGLVLFAAAPSLPDGRGKAVAGIRYRLAPAWSGRTWRISAADLKLPNGADPGKTIATNLLASLAAPSGDEKGDVAKALIRDDAFNAALVKLQSGAAQDADREVLARELNLLLQSKSVTLPRLAGEVPTDFSVQCGRRRAKFAELFGALPEPSVLPRAFTNQLRPARAVDADPQVAGTLLGITHDEQTPFVLDRRKEAADRLTGMRGAAERLGSTVPPTEGTQAVTNVLPPLIDVVSWSARPGEFGIDRWSVQSHQAVDNAGLQRIGLAQQAAVRLRRPRARAGRDEKIQLQRRADQARWLLGFRFHYDQFILDQTLGATAVPKDEGDKHYRAITLVAVDRTQFLPAVGDVRLAPTKPAIFTFQMKNATPEIKAVSIVVVARTSYTPSTDSSQRKIKVKKSNNEIVEIPAPWSRAYVVALAGAKGVGSVYSSAPAIPAVVAGTTMDQMAGETTLAGVISRLKAPELPDVANLVELTAADSSGWTSFPAGSSAAVYLPLAIGNDPNKPLDAKAQKAALSNGQTPLVVAVATYNLVFETEMVDGQQVAKGFDTWKWQFADLQPDLPQAEIYVNFVDQAGAIIPPKMSAALLAYPRHPAQPTSVNPDKELFLAGYRLLDDKDFTPIEPRPASDVPPGMPGAETEYLEWTRRTELQAILRPPASVDGDAPPASADRDAPPYHYDIVVTGPGGELIPTRKILE